MCPAPSIALEQADPEIGFDDGDALAQNARRQVEMLGSDAEAQRFRKIRELAKRFDAHADPFE